MLLRLKPHPEKPSALVVDYEDDEQVPSTPTLTLTFTG